MNSWRIALNAWQILEPADRRSGYVLMAIVVLSALSSAAMVGSFMPFLYVLAEPETIHSSQLLSAIYDRFDFRSDTQFLKALGIVCLVVILVSALLQLFRVYAVSRWCMMRMHSISRRLLATNLSQPYEYFITRNTGSLSTQILSESQAAVGQFYRPFTDGVAGVMTVSAIVGLLLIAYPVVSIAAFGIFASLYGAIFLLTKNIANRAGERRLQANKERFRMVGEALGGVKAVKMGGHEVTYSNRYNRPSLKFARAQILVAVLGEMPRHSMQAIAFAGGVIFFLFLIDGQGPGSSMLTTTVPIAGVFAAAAIRIMPELSRVYFGLVKLQAAGPAIEAICRELQPREARPQDTDEALRLTESLRFDNISYAYPGSKRGNALEKINETIRAGEKIGIVGGTGAGKTTFIDIVLGLLLPSDGVMVLDGQILMETNKRAWRKSIGYVPQQIFLSDGTVAENIAFGLADKHIDHERVETAATTAQIHDFIVHELPNGYDTEVGQNGIQLSGGQRQRIGIARALYNDPDLIVFDEATSALDNITEEKLTSAIENMSGRKTIILVAHRLSTVQKCDRIFLFENGSIVSKGSWDELQRHSPEFQAIARQPNM